MAALFVHSIQTEWIKRKRTLASWLVIIGAFFTPVIVTLVQLARPEKLPERYQAAEFWENHFRNAWQSMVSLLLPMGIILAVGLMAQMENRNSTWKQLHTTPQPLAFIYLSKFTVLLFMEVQLFLLFTVGIVLSAVVPAFVLEAVDFPAQPIPLAFFARESAYYFFFSLPIVAFQYLLALQFRNFLIPLGAGMLMMVTTIVLFSWERIYVFPYSYGMIHLMGRFPEQPLVAWSMGWFTLFFVAGYLLYYYRKDRT
ncbi:MAG: ABC transporter permease [Cyclobacteriaceae bacterium]|nr:ABC transporter permease [Cyclobacteriaceae bacterium]